MWGRGAMKRARLNRCLLPAVSRPIASWSCSWTRSKRHSATKTISIRNAGEEPLDFSLDVYTINDFVFLSDRSFSLVPGEEKIIEANIIGKKLGSYIGEIEIEAGGLKKSVTVVVEVESEQALFDAKIDVTTAYKEVKNGDDLKAQITLLNVGPPKKVDVTATYLIKDKRGNVMHESSETFAVEKQTSYVKSFRITDNYKPGDYLIAVEIRYENSFAVSSELFSVTQEKSLISEVVKSSPMALIFITLVGFVLLFAYLLVPRMKFFNFRKKK
ncbi:hypothetical protein HYT92_02900 [Candidatus Pacearchaeota archaeon]|nr:hypothetical protein [Candidatus Pacearchaeota archaeon]